MRSTYNNSSSNDALYLDAYDKGTRALRVFRVNRIKQMEFTIWHQRQDGDRLLLRQVSRHLQHVCRRGDHHGQGRFSSGSPHTSRRVCGMGRNG
jgi:predicted DNA-binding transcriptional regulator YafY